MNLKNRIQDIFEKYSVQLEVEDKEVDLKHTPDHKEDKDEMQLAKKTLANGTVIYTDADEFGVGVNVFIVNEEGERMPLPDGEYEYEEGGKTIVANGKIAEMVEAEEEKEEKEMKDHEDKEMDKHKEKEEKMKEHEEKDKKDMEEEEDEKKFTKKEVEEMVKKAVKDAKEKMHSQIEDTNTQLKELKELMSSQVAESGLRRSASAPQRVQLSDIKNMKSQKDRVSFIHDFYLNK